ncbi:MAG: DUF3293 domain-containing protein [Rhodocyclaceae bacterium]|nr:DUF3293 domain-containing protein [Rhodocyclaceae bacterium]
MSEIDPALIECYRSTLYRVNATPAFTLQIGVESKELRELHRLHGGTSAFLTACNPYSQQLSEAENIARQENLRADLVAEGCVVIDGVGQHPSNGWPGEPSFLALNISFSLARALGKKYEQNAILLNLAAGKPELVLLR